MERVGLQGGGRRRGGVRGGFTRESSRGGAATDAQDRAHLQEGRRRKGRKGVGARVRVCWCRKEGGRGGRGGREEVEEGEGRLERIEGRWVKEEKEGGKGVKVVIPWCVY